MLPSATVRPSRSTPRTPRPGSVRTCRKSTQRSTAAAATKLSIARAERMVAAGSDAAPRRATLPPNPPRQQRRIRSLSARQSSMCLSCRTKPHEPEPGVPEHCRGETVPDVAMPWSRHTRSPAESRVPTRKDKRPAPRPSHSGCLVPIHRYGIARRTWPKPPRSPVAKRSRPRDRTIARNSPWQRAPAGRR